MDDKAQTSLEYLIIVTMLIIITAILGLLSSNLFSLKNATTNANTAIKDNLINMIQ